MEEAQGLECKSETVTTPVPRWIRQEEVAETGKDENCVGKATQSKKSQNTAG